MRAAGQPVRAETDSNVESNNLASRLTVESRGTLLARRHMTNSQIDLPAGDPAKLIHSKSLQEL